MSQSALSKRPADVAGSPAEAGPTTGERLVRAAEQSWRPLALLLAALVVWWAIAAAELIEAYLVPSPGATLDVLTTKAGYLWQHTWVTTYETLLGFAIAVVVGVLAAVVMVYSSTVERTLYPIRSSPRSCPRSPSPALRGVARVRHRAQDLIAVLIAFFPVVISMVTGLKAVDPEMLQLSATMGAKPWQTFVKIRFPASLPHLFSGLKVAVTLAVTGAVVGEFVGANEGLGYVILQANGNLDTPMLFAGLLVMSLIGVVLFVVVEIAEKLLLPWHASRRDTSATTTF